MTMKAEILCIGPYSEAVANHLDYPRSAYVGVENGTRVVRHLCKCQTLGESLILAESVNVRPNNFSTHEINTTVLNPKEVCELFPEWAEAFKVLMNNKFQFLYLPNFDGKKRHAFERVTVYSDDNL